MDRTEIQTGLSRRIETRPGFGTSGFLIVEDTSYDNRRISSSLTEAQRIRIGMALLGQNLMRMLGDFDAAVTGLREGRDVNLIAAHLEQAYAQFEHLMDVEEAGRALAEANPR